MMTPIKLRHALAPRDFEVSCQDALKLQTLFAKIEPSSHQVSSVHAMAGLGGYAIKPYVDNGPDLDASLDSFLLDKVVIPRQHQQQVVKAPQYHQQVVQAPQSVGARSRINQSETSPSASTYDGISDLDNDLDAFISPTKHGVLDALPSANEPAGQRNVRMQNTLESLFKAVAGEDRLKPGHGAIKRALNKNKAQEKKEAKEKADAEKEANKAAKAATKTANKKKKATKAAKPTATSETNMKRRKHDAKSINEV